MENENLNNLVVIVKTEKDTKKLQNFLNSGYVIHGNSRCENGDYWILGKPEIRPERPEKPEIESYRVLNPKEPDCQKETVSLQKKGFKIDDVKPSSVILLKYKEVKKNA